jgi:hypothetical protein
MKTIRKLALVAVLLVLGVALLTSSAPAGATGPNEGDPPVECETPPEAAAVAAASYIEPEPCPEPEPITVTPVELTVVPFDCAVDGYAATVTVPEVEGVVYVYATEPIPAGDYALTPGEYHVTVHADDGYVFAPDAPTEFHLTVEPVNGCPGPPGEPGAPGLPGAPAAPPTVDVDVEVAEPAAPVAATPTYTG